MASIFEKQARAPGETMLMAQVSAAHAVSHIHIMTVPALIPFLTDHYGVGYLELGTAITLFSIVSLLAHIPIGALTDRIGSRPMLFAGLVLGSASFASLAWFDTYNWLLVAMIAAGLANGVYHPGGYAMISTGVAPARAGRSFSIYTFAGFMGTAVTPAGIYAVVVNSDVSMAFLATAIIGALAALFLLLPRSSGTAETLPESQRTEAQPHPTLADIFNPTIAMLTLIFMLLALSSIGIHNFTVAVLADGYGLDLGVANIALTCFLFASAFGVLAGGVLADRTSRHGTLAAISFAITGVVTAILTITLPPAWLIVAMLTIAGFTFGIIAPSRDMLVRAAAPAGAVGRVFAIVSTGFNSGGVVGPPVFGWLLDNVQPNAVFALVTLLIFIAIIVMWLADRKARL